MKRMFLLLTAASIVTGAWLALGGWHPWRGNVAPRFERGSLRRCPGDRPDPWLQTMAVNGTLITVTQTDAGARAGADEPDAFTDLVLGCLTALGGETETLHEYLPNMNCELWLHNLAIVARNGDVRSSDALNAVPGLAELLDRGRPIDMNTAVWAGNVRGRPWDGRPPVCAAVRRVLTRT